MDGTLGTPLAISARVSTSWDEKLFSGNYKHVYVSLTVTRSLLLVEASLVAGVCAIWPVITNRRPRKNAQ